MIQTIDYKGYEIEKHHKYTFYKIEAFTNAYYSTLDVAKKVIDTYLRRKNIVINEQPKVVYKRPEAVYSNKNFNV